MVSTIIPLNVTSMIPLHVPLSQPHLSFTPHLPHLTVPPIIRHIHQCTTITSLPPLFSTLQPPHRREHSPQASHRHRQYHLKYMHL
ncbi:hypothetical protein EX30DRAFT_79059 [Ascodesmis nigricans]|uniref:Uncharacterized protein n=1 Tax=Ascodesmis nigricans TaxID=341454 RepID=A0A4V3SIC1_9PEZI|nr:hypothetical protein EX30DRAFT_79059 [Ascodesmis nigricans]